MNRILERLAVPPIRFATFLIRTVTGWIDPLPGRGQPPVMPDSLFDELDCDQVVDALESIPPCDLRPASYRGRKFLVDHGRLLRNANGDPIACGLGDPAVCGETRECKPDAEERTMTDGSPETADHREIQPNGQQKGYVVLSETERAKGYVRPMRSSYVHDACGAVTTMTGMFRRAS